MTHHISRHFRSNSIFYFAHKWLPTAILDDRKSLSIAFLDISVQYATFIFFHKMAASGHFGWPKISLDLISRHFRSIRNFYFVSQNGCQRPFWMTENHFWSHFSPFQINTKLFFHKMSASGHFGWPKITFECISRHFRSIRNFLVWFSFSKWPPGGILEVRFGPFWMTENHFRSHFSPFQINTQLVF